jgi:glyoxalase family protein
MPSGPLLSDFHHATSFAGNPQSNIEFHNNALGLHLVKRTVNFDEPAAWHLYYSSGLGEPGTILTTFPGYSPRPSARSNLVICLRGKVPDAFRQHEPRRFGEDVFSLRDPDGLLLELTPGEGPLHLHSATLQVAAPEPTIAFFTRVLGFSVIATEGPRTRVESEGGAVRVDILADPAASRSRFGAGITHHIAFQVAGEAQQLAWRDRLIASNVRVSLVKDRYYFHSIYFREPSGILLEIATSGPGFLIDEPAQYLGESLRLPPWFEPIREKIEVRLKPLARSSASLKEEIPEHDVV